MGFIACIGVPHRPETPLGCDFCPAGLGIYFATAAESDRIMGRKKDSPNVTEQLIWNQLAWWLNLAEFACVL